MKKETNRWLALIVLCLGTLMIVLDTTIVNVALPSIKASLGFSDTGLAWIINAYTLTFAGFLLLGGKLGDLYGQRKLFLIGLTLFTLSSILCGVAGSQFFLIAARALQGIGGAITDAVALSLVLSLFPEPDARAKAMGVFGFVAAGGGSVGAFLGGILTGTFNWHWIFLVNVPIGILVFVLTLYLISSKHEAPAHVHLDVWGAVTVTASLMLAVYAIVNGNVVGWGNPQTWGLLGVAVLLMALFLWIETKVKEPLMPLSILKLRSVAVANSAGILWSASMFAWFFLSALYMQLVLNYTPLQVGLAFIPANVIMALFSIGLSAKMVTRFGIKWPLTAGLVLTATGLFWFSTAGVEGTFWWMILPPMILMGFGAGISFNPMLLAAMNDVREDESGLASGIVNTAFMMGGALGLAILASVAATRTSHVFINDMRVLPEALSAGYDLAFIVGGIFALAAATLVATLLKVTKSEHSAVH